MILVTGATGFVGRALCERLNGHDALRIAVDSATGYVRRPTDTPAFVAS